MRRHALATKAVDTIEQTYREFARPAPVVIDLGKQHDKQDATGEGRSPHYEGQGRTHPKGLQALVGEQGEQPGVETIGPEGNLRTEHANGLPKGQPARTAQR